MATKTKAKATPATKPSHLDVLNEIAVANESRLEAVHRELLAEAAGKPIAPEVVVLLTPALGDHDAVKRARRDAKNGLTFSRMFRQTEGAAERAAQARAERDARVPELRRKIAELERNILELERAPLQHERQAEQHEGAIVKIRAAAPAFIRARYKAEVETHLKPLREQWARLKGEHSKLHGLVVADPNNRDHRHFFERARAADGSQPWRLKDMHGRTIISPQAWRQFLASEHVEERCNELAEQIEQLESEIAEIEADLGTILCYWLGVYDEFAAEADESGE